MHHQQPALFQQWPQFTPSAVASDIADCLDVCLPAFTLYGATQEQRAHIAACAASLREMAQAFKLSQDH